MKKLLFFILLFSIKQLNAQTNVYHPFPDSSALWNETSFVQCCATIVYNPQIEFFGGDTVISTLHYKKIMASGYKTAGSTCCNYINKYLGAMRQDTASKKIYFCAVGTTNDTLLYDFNLQLGDTLKPTYISYAKSNYISKIDSILIGNSYRKQYHLNPTYTVNGMPPIDYVSLIEGIGSTLGLFYRLEIPFEAGSQLNCFSQNGLPLYPTGADSCSSTVSILQLKNIQSIINIFPNPAQNNFTIETSVSNKQTLQVFDVNGKMVLTQTINGITSIDADALVQGVYNVSLTSNEGVVNKRLVIIK